MRARSLLFGLVVMLCACGGGGSSSSSAPQAPPPGGSGGGGGGGGSSSDVVVRGGLTSGGVGIVVDTGSSGVLLDVAVGGTDLSLGGVQAFGSVVTNDRTFDTDSAEFFVEGLAAVQADIEQGQQVLIVADGDTASSVLYRANVKGPITSLNVINALNGRATLTVLGQTVVTDAATTFVDMSVPTLMLNDLVEVSGVLQADDSIRASFVEGLNALTTYKATGQVRNLSGDEFSLGGLTVDTSGASFSNFDGDVAELDVVEVRAAPASFDGSASLVADEVERLPTLTVGDQALVRVEGFIDRFVSFADFDVQTTPVRTTASTVFSNGDSESLGLGVKVQVDGALGTDGFVSASTVVVQRTNAVRVEGPVEAVDTAGATLTALGVAFVVRDGTRLEDDSSAAVDPLTLDDITSGDRVELRGYVDGMTTVATKIEREDLEDEAELRGPVTAEDPDAGTIDILGVTITGQAGVTEFEDDEDVPLTQSEFHDRVEVGTYVRARWDIFAGTSLVADDLSIVDEDD